MNRKQHLFNCCDLLYLQSGEADAMSLDGGFVYIASQCGLVPVMAENYHGKCKTTPSAFLLLGHGERRGENHSPVCTVALPYSVSATSQTLDSLMQNLHSHLLKRQLLHPSVVGIEALNAMKSLLKLTLLQRTSNIAGWPSSFWTSCSSCCLDAWI